MIAGKRQEHIVESRRVRLRIPVFEAWQSVAAHIRHRKSPDDFLDFFQLLFQFFGCLIGLLGVSNDMRGDQNDQLSPSCAVTGTSKQSAQYRNPSDQWHSTLDLLTALTDKAAEGDRLTILDNNG